MARVVFLGTPDFAVPSLRKLAQAQWCEVVLVVTQPDRPVGRKQIMTPPPVKQCAIELGIPVIQPERVRKDETLNAIAAVAPDVLVTAAYGQLLPQKLLDLPTVGSVNVHASLLPRWRGAAPIHRAVLAGDKMSGVSIMEMVMELDAGPVLDTVKVAIGEDMTSGELHDLLSVEGANLLAKVLPPYLNAKLLPTAQPTEGVTFAGKLERTDEWIDWSLDCRSVHNQIRGLCPWPGASSTMDGRPVKIWKSKLSANLSPADAEYGTILEMAGTVGVRCRDGWLEIRTVQPAGKRQMSAVDWVRGLHGRELRFGSANS